MNGLSGPKQKAKTCFSKRDGRERAKNQIKYEVLCLKLPRLFYWFSDLKQKSVTDSVSKKLWRKTFE